MWLNMLWRRWLGHSRSYSGAVGRRRKSPYRPRTRLRLEALEDRTLLSGGGVTSTTGLIAAINSANTAGGATTITLASGATFHFTTTNNTTNGANALPVINVNNNNTAITIVGPGDMISDAGGNRFFDVASGGSLTLEGLTLIGGIAYGPGAAAEGGAIYNSGNLTLSGVTVKSNFAHGSSGRNGTPQNKNGGNGLSAAGGGLYSAGGTVTLTGGTVFASNKAVGGYGGNGSYNASYHRTSLIGGNGGSGGDGAGGAVYVAAGNVIMTDATLSNNYVNGGGGGSGGNGFMYAGGNGGNSGSGMGGGMYVLGGVVTMYDDTLSGNHAIGSFGGGGGFGETRGGNGGNGGSGYGGGLYVGGGAGTPVVTLNNAILSNNRAGFSGVYNGGDSGGSKNRGIRGVPGDGWGGGLYAAAGTLTMGEDILVGNLALGTGNSQSGPLYGVGFDGGNGYGGAVSVGGGAVTLFDSTLMLNQAVGGDGGDGHAGASSGNGGLAYGGGVYAIGGAVNLFNDTLYANSARGGFGGTGTDGGTAGVGGSAQGGGLVVGSGAVTVTLTNDTLSNNGAQGGNLSYRQSNAFGGGIMSYAGEGTASLVLLNTLIADNFVAGTTTSGPDVWGDVPVSDHTLISNSSGSTGFGEPGSDDIIAPSYLGLNALSSSNNGPYTVPYAGAFDSEQAMPTMALLPDSPAIDAGDRSALGNNNLPNQPATEDTDQRGNARVVGNTVDIGAVEYQYEMYISGNAPSEVQAGQDITYSIAVPNEGPDIAGNGGGVVLTDVLPGGVTFVSAQSSPGWILQNGTATATIPTLDAGASATFTLVLQTSASTPSTLNNTITVGPSTWDLANNSITFTTTVSPAGPVDLSSSSPPVVGLSPTHNLGLDMNRKDPYFGDFVQQITITNLSSSPLSGPLALQLTGLSSNATLVNASGAYQGDPYFDFLSAGQSLAAGQSITVTLYFKDPTHQAITYGTPQVWQGLS